MNELIDIQKAQKASDAEFAAWLGVERSHWYSVRTGRRRIGLKLMRGAIARNQALSYYAQEDLKAGSA